MSKITEKEVVQLLQERVEKLENKIKKIQTAIEVLAEPEDADKPKLHKKEKKLIRTAKSELKKERRKKDKGKKEHLATTSPAHVTTRLPEPPALDEI